MAVNYSPPDSLPNVPGVRLGVAQAGIKSIGRPDIAIIALDPGAHVSGVFTRNAFCAPPVTLCRQRLASGKAIRGLLINSGNANAATGDDGMADAIETCAVVAEQLGCDSESVLPFSTGVIGARLPLKKMLAAIPTAVSSAREDRWRDAMNAIMTTDTVPKGASRQVQTSAGTLTVTGIAKGVGMICPDMATMLAYIATDASLTQSANDQLLKEVVADSFNCVTVDGDTSTNDACMLISTGKVGARPMESTDADYSILRAAVKEVCIELAQAIVRDGEGATKFITLEVDGARDRSEARAVAYTVAHSPLVKTAMFASDANWGRIVMAIGNAGLDQLDPAGVSIAMNDVQLIEGGQPHPGYTEALGAAVVAKPEFTLRISLGRGQASVRVWTCDFSYDYVRINAEYRT